MGDWYLIGLTVGIGVAAGIAFASVLASLRFGYATTTWRFISIAWPQGSIRSCQVRDRSSGRCARPSTKV